MIRVAGVQRGRPDITSAEAADMVANWAPEEVPILAEHGGDVLGYLDDLKGHGRDLWFMGTIRDDALGLLATSEGASIERYDPAVEATPDNWSGRIVPTSSHWRGHARAGWNLTAVALVPPGRVPACPGSAMWRIPR